MAYIPYLVVSTEDTTTPVRLFDRQTLDELSPPATSQLRTGQSSRCTAVSPDGSTLAVGYGDARVYFYDTETFEQVLTPITEISSQPVSGLSWTPDGGSIAVAYGGSAGCRVYSVPSMTRTQTLAASSALSCAFSPDGQFLAYTDTGSPYVRIYDTSTWTLVTLGANPTGAGYSVAFSPDSQRLAVGHGTSPFVTVYNTSTWATIALSGGNPPNIGFSVAFSRAGDRLVVGSATTSPYMALYDTSTWTKITVTDSGLATALHYGAKWTPDDDGYLLGRSASPYIILRSRATNARQTIPSNSITTTVRSFEFLPEKLIASGFSDTSFGVPLVPSLTQTGDAEGWLGEALFGNALAIPDLLGQADAWQSISFGDGYGATAFRAETWRPVRFGLAATPLLSIAKPKSFSRTMFGTAYGLVSPLEVKENATAFAASVRVTKFGNASVLASVALGHTGVSFPSFGVAKASSRHSVTGSQDTLFGGHHSLYRAKAAGYRISGFGTAAASAGHVVFGRMHTKLGIPRAQIGGHTAKGWLLARFGAHRGRNIAGAHLATGLVHASFGVAAARTQLGVVQVAPGTRIGRPTLRRNPTC